MKENVEFSEQDLIRAKQEIVNNFGHGGQARVLMISVENYERNDHVRAVDKKIIKKLLEGNPL